MHLKENELLKLAIAEYYGILLTDTSIKKKMHLAECKKCYKKFCTYIIIINLIYIDKIYNKMYNYVI